MGVAVGRYRKGFQKVLGQTCTLIHADLGTHSLTEDHLFTWRANDNYNVTDPSSFFKKKKPLNRSDKFNLTSCQFAMHYMMESEQKFRNFISMVASHLKSGGRFVATTVDANMLLSLVYGMGKVDPKDDARVLSIRGYNNFETCRVRIGRETLSQLHLGGGGGGERTSNVNIFGLRYTFELRDSTSDVSVDAPEWLVPLRPILQIAEEYGLFLENCQNFHDIIHQDLQSIYASLNDTRRRSNILDCEGSIPVDNWMVIGMY